MRFCRMFWCRSQSKCSGRSDCIRKHCQRLQCSMPALVYPHRWSCKSKCSDCWWCLVSSLEAVKFSNFRSPLCPGLLQGDVVSRLGDPPSPQTHSPPAFSSCWSWQKKSYCLGSGCFECRGVRSWKDAWSYLQNLSCEMNALLREID